MHILPDLFLTHAKISATCFGGGYAIIPILQREVSDKKKWIADSQLNDMFSLAQCTPGAIAVNAATFIGSTVAGVPGAICATLGILLPPTTIILLVATFLWPYLSLPLVSHALAGIQVCVCALISQAVLRLFRGAVLDATTLILFLIALGISFFTSISPAYLIVSSGIFGSLMFLWREGRK